MPLEHLHIHIDGGSRGNPGPAAAGVVFRDADNDLTLYEAGHWIGRTTNNVAEYSALLTALKLAGALKPRHTLIHSDSELMVKQINGQYRVKSPDLQPLYTQAMSMLRQLGGTWKIVHVYREKNARADELANKSMDAGRTVIDSPLVNLDAPVGTGGTVAAIVAVAPPVPAATGLFDKKVSPQPAPQQPQPTPATITPGGSRYTLTFTRAPGAGCPAACPSGKEYSFARTTPVGLCIHAASAVLIEVTSADDPGDVPATVQCGRCDVAIRVDVDR